MLVRIEIDTTGQNEDSSYKYKKYPYNEQLWNILVPNIKYLGTLEGLQPSSEIDWAGTKKYFEDGDNKHCIIQKSGGYIAAYEYIELYFEKAFLESVADFTYPNQPLSYLLAEIAKKNKIEWAYLKEYEETFKDCKNPSMFGLISLFNEFKLVTTPLINVKKEENL